MFVDFMMCFKYSRGSLARQHELEIEAMCGVRVRHRRGHIDTVFPFELGPHAAELKGNNKQSVSRVYAEVDAEKTCLCFCAIGRFDVVHDINMDVAQDDGLLRQIRALPKDASKNHTGLRR